MNPLEFFSYIQLTIFILGVITILIAGVQDKKNRLAPAIYFSPTLIGFGLNPFLGLAGAIITLLAITFWKEAWNKIFGLADALLYVTMFMCMSNSTTLLFIIPINVGVFAELFLLKQKQKEVPLIWIYAKWITIILTLTILFLLIKGFYG